MPKLPRNMIKRSDRPGYWFRRMEGGKVRWQSLGTDYDDACRQLRELKRTDTPIVHVTVSEAAKRWLASYVATSRNEKGQALADLRVERYLTKHLGCHLVHRLSSEHLREYKLLLENLKDDEDKPVSLSVQTVSHLLSDARCFLRWCVEAGYIARSPFPRKLLPRVQERLPDRLSESEIEVVKALPDPWGFVCRLGLATGLRWGELCRSQASDIERGFLVVHRKTKSGKIRRVPLEPEILSELRNRVGRLVPYSEKSPGTFSRRVRDKSEVEGFHVHRLRHTFACCWLEKGRSLAALQLVLGHASIETTQRYARLTDDAVMREIGTVVTRTVTR
jgi:integrase